MNYPSNITLESEDLRTAIIGLGANMTSLAGEPRGTLEAAIVQLGKLFSQGSIHSSFYQTEAVGCPPGTEDFINAVIALDIPKSVTAAALLARLQQLEIAFGRETGLAANSPRPLDLDLLYFGHLSLSSPDLQIPHPRASQRRFVMEPLAEIAPELVLPGQSVSARELLEKLPATPKVHRLP